MAEVDSKTTEAEKQEVKQRYAKLSQDRDNELGPLCQRSPDVCKAILSGLLDDDQKLIALTSELRNEGKGKEAAVVGYIANGNLSSANTIATTIKSNGDTVTLLAADAAKLLGVGVIPGWRTGSGKSLSDATNEEIATITLRTTKNQTRLGGEAGELGIKVVYKDGTEFDMTQTRVKETEANPYVPGSMRPVRFEDALDNKGIKRAPTQDELDWFNSIKWDR